MSNLLKWAAIVEHSSPQVLAKLLHDQATESRLLREVCRLAATQLAMVTINMTQGGRARTHTESVIADLAQAGKEATDAM